MNRRTILALCGARLLAGYAAISCLAIPEVRAETFSSPGFYLVTVDGWTRTVTQDGFIYRCISCVDQVEIEILREPLRSPLSRRAAWRTTDEFIAAVDTPEKQRAFAEEWLKPPRPNAPYRFELHHVELTEIGGLKMLVIASKFVQGHTVMPDISMISVHTGRLMRLRLHTLTGALTAEGNEIVDAFLGALVFEK